MAHKTKWTTIGFVEYWNGLNNWIEHSETKWVLLSFSNFWKFTTRTTNFYFFQKRHQKTLDTLFWSLTKCHPLWRWSVGVVTPVVNWAPVMWKIVAVHRTKWATGSGQFSGANGKWDEEMARCFVRIFYEMWECIKFLCFFFLVKKSPTILARIFLFRDQCMSKRNIEG